MTAPAEPWWLSFFGETYAEIGLIPGSAAAETARDAAVDFIVRELGLTAGDRLFDQCCGVGRMSIPLAARGLSVVGVDITEAYVERARARAAEQGVRCELHVGDAFEFVADQPCDGGINWFTSFGYSADDRLNRQMLVRAHASLVPGGRFAIDYINMARVLSDFQRCGSSRHTLPDGSELLLLDERVIDFPAGMMRSTWTFIHPDGRRQLGRTEIRSFLPHELCRLAESAGFCEIRLVGSVAGEPFDRLSPRCILIATRPG